MLAYMNKESIERLLKQEWFIIIAEAEMLFGKETSGNIQRLIDIYYDCDNDSLLIWLNK